MPLIDPALWDVTLVFASSQDPLPVPPKVEVRPVRVHVPDRELHTTVVRGIGFRATADGKPVGPVRSTYAEARADLRKHRKGDA